jgi:hypothetical protein
MRQDQSITIVVETTSIVSVTSTVTGPPFTVTDYGKIDRLVSPSLFSSSPGEGEDRKARQGTKEES